MSELYEITWSRSPQEIATVDIHSEIEFENLLDAVLYCLGNPNIYRYKMYAGISKSINGEPVIMEPHEMDEAYENISEIFSFFFGTVDGEVR